VHTADAVRFVLGREPLTACALGRSSSGMAAGAHDLVMATFRFEGGALAQLHADFGAPNGRSRLEVHGSRGSLLGMDVLGKSDRHRGRVVLCRAGGEEQLAVESEDSRYGRVIERFHAAVLGTGAPACSGRDGVRSLAMVVAAEESARSACSVPVSEAGRP
jgi:1,5-anhydro-D-fructose reductase (1,5-anhydro-D-mannitol-forming)